MSRILQSSHHPIWLAGPPASTGDGAAAFVRWERRVPAFPLSRLAATPAGVAHACRMPANSARGYDLRDDSWLSPNVKRAHQFQQPRRLPGKVCAVAESSSVCAELDWVTWSICVTAVFTCSTPVLCSDGCGRDLTHDFGHPLHRADDALQRRA